MTSQICLPFSPNYGFCLNFLNRINSYLKEMIKYICTIILNICHKLQHMDVTRDVCRIETFLFNSFLLNIVIEMMQRFKDSPTFQCQV